MKQVMVGIIGGGMRAVEACYLAHQAACEITVFDQDPHCAAADLADVFVCTDLHKTDVSDDLLDCDFLLPALDDAAVLERIDACARHYGVPFLYDQAADRIRVSAERTEQMLLSCGIPHLPYGGTQLYEVLPGGAAREAKTAAYAIQVIGDGKTFVPLMVTRILTDADSRRCRVEAGMELPQEVREQMIRLGMAVGTALHLRGICTVEAVRRDGQLYVSDVDTHLPAQMPAAVYHATGLNLLSLLYDVAHGSLTEAELPHKGYAVCEHIAVDGPQIRTESMHAMKRAGRLQYTEYFFGCPEALTNFRPGRQDWVATLIAHDADSLENVYNRLERTYGRIAQHAQLHPTYRRAI